MLIEKEFTFFSRHSESYEEIYTDNRISAILKTALHRDLSEGSDNTDSEDQREFANYGGESQSTLLTGRDFPYTKFDSYLYSDSAVREDKWESAAHAELRYLNQNADILQPEKKGLSPLNFLITGNYTGEHLAALAEVGDTTLEESTNTIDYLTRRGGKASVSVKNVTLNGFGVMGQEAGYEIDGLGLGFNSNDHIMGGSARFDFFDNQMSLKAIYATGGDDGNYLGTWSETDGRKGDVTGLLWITDFFDQKLMSEIEVDTANYDYDTSDEEEKVSDKAYRIRISGLQTIYDYEVGYKYTGPQYDVVGNQSIVKDWEGFNFIGGMTFTEHALRLLLDYSWNNVEDDDYLPRITSFTGGLDYQYSGWELFPVSVLFEHNQQNSEDEPENSDQTNLDTNTLTGTVGFFQGSWAAEIRSSYSEQNDKTVYDYDTQLFTLSLIPSYSGSYFSILPSWTLNSSKDLSSGVRTDINTLTLDLYSSFLQDTVVGEIGGTYDWSETDDDSIDLNNTSFYARLSYRLNQTNRLEDTTLAFEYIYNRLEDNVYDSTIYEGVLSLVISTAIPYSY
ncbi:MAG: hypothetical protein HKP52_07990 [Desulfofustis sp.]|nr:hypothetical protein [Desulfofustis sp.]